MNERDIFQAAVEIENSTERAGFLDQACVGQPGLKSNVLALLKHYEDAGSFLERPPAEFEQTRLLGEQGTDENSLASTHSPEGPISDLTLKTYLSPSETPGVMGTLGQYDVLEKIGQGGMGLVLKAKDTKLERIVAIKLLAPELASNAMARKRFLREAKAAAAVTHDHVVRIYAVNESSNPPMLVMECIIGQSLQQKIDRNGALGVKEILRIGLQAALGLAAAHKQGLVHRDIKPSNILLENGIERVKITDFGLARAVDDIGMTQTGQITGTPQYMSPEQAQGDLVDYRSDLFSLGSVLYAMCTGRAAFRADSTVAVLRRVCDDEPRPIQDINPEIPLALAAVVEQLMDKDPNRRFQSAEEVAEVLSDLLAQIQQPGGPLPIPSLRYQKPESQAQRPRERFHPFSLGKLFLALGIVLLGFCISEATGVTKLASTLIRVAKGEGTLVVEVDDPGVSVTIEGEDIVITGAGPNEVRLKPGQYRLTATKDGAPIRQDLVNITRNGKNIVRISLEGAGAKPREALSEQLRKNLEFSVQAGRGKLRPEELKLAFEVPVNLRIVQLLAKFPDSTRQELIENGYLKWPYAELNESYRESFLEIVEMFLNQAQDMGFGGKETSRESARELLKTAQVGFAAIDYPNSQQAITFYILAKHSPVPIGMPIVPENPKDWESLELGLPQFDQLKKLAEKPNSAFPKGPDASLLTLPSKISIEQSQLLVKGGFRPTWTPDGNQILYSGLESSSIELYDLTQGQSQSFLTVSDLDPNQVGKSAVLDAAISPDGNTVATVLRPLAKGNDSYLQEEVWVVPFSEGAARGRIGKGGYPCFGKESVLMYFQDRQRNMLCSVRLDSDAKPQDVMPCGGWYPAISPDGQWLAYSMQNELFIASLKSGEMVAKWKCQEPASGMIVSWSPDSKRVGACPYSPRSRLGFWCYDLDQKQPVEISRFPIGEVAWSPDGKQLAYTLYLEGPKIYLIATEKVPGLLWPNVTSPEPNQIESSGAVEKSSDPGVLKTAQE